MPRFLHHVAPVGTTGPVTGKCYACVEVEAEGATHTRAVSYVNGCDGSGSDVVESRLFADGYGTLIAGGR